MIRRRARRFIALVFLGLVGLLVLAGFLFWRRLEPMPRGAAFYVRYETAKGTAAVLEELQQRGVVRDASAIHLFGRLTGAPEQVSPGTYRFHPGLTARQIIGRLRKPIVEMVRIPDTNWSRRTAKLLETKYQICNADDYMALVNDPASFAADVDFPLPKGSLEGYLYPDTYPLEPLMGARAVVLRQLKAFQTRVWEPLNHPKNLRRLLTLASMVQLEAGPSHDKPKIAGVIENRLAKKMRLQIDATILYGIQKWRRLTFADYRNLKTPYNTYLHDGLPPGPICSPNAESIEAAMHPDRQGGYLFYIAMPDGRTVFASTFAEHKHNIRLRDLQKKAWGR